MRAQITDTVSHITDTAHRANVATVITPPSHLSFLDLLFKGGWVMVPIVLLLLIGIYIFIERYLTLRKASRKNTTLLMQIRQHILSGNLEAAIAICRNTPTPISRMLQKGLQRIGKPIKEIERAIENMGKIETAKLEKNIGTLGIIAGIAPMLGFVGTIAGVIKIFYNISLADNLSIGLVADGLYQKMITSVSGLLVGILAYLGHHVLNMMIDAVTLQMETDAVEFIDLLEEPVKY